MILARLLLPLLQGRAEVQPLIRWSSAGWSVGELQSSEPHLPAFKPFSCGTLGLPRMRTSLPFATSTVAPKHFPKISPGNSLRQNRRSLETSRSFAINIMPIELDSQSGDSPNSKPKTPDTNVVFETYLKSRLLATRADAFEHDCECISFQPDEAGCFDRDRAGCELASDQGSRKGLLSLPAGR